MAVLETANLRWRLAHLTSLETINLDSDEDEQENCAPRELLQELPLIAKCQVNGTAHISGSVASCTLDGGEMLAPQLLTRRSVVPTPVRSREAGPPFEHEPAWKRFKSSSSSMTESIAEIKDEPCESIKPPPPAEGYTLRDLRRITSTMLPRYGHLLTATEHTALTGFSRLPLGAQQLYARLLGRKWPQWVRLDGLGDRYAELGDVAARAAVNELSAKRSQALTGPTKPPPLPDGAEHEIASPDAAAASAANIVAPWLLDSSSETAATLLAQALQRPGEGPSSSEDSYGTLLLEAQPMADLRQLARGLGISDMPKGRTGVKGRLVDKLCDAARRQRSLAPAGHAGRSSVNSTEVRLVDQVLHTGHWVCIAPTPGREALSLLSDLFHLETSGVVESSFMVFSTRWSKYHFDEHAASPLFADRVALDSFLAARRFSVRLEQSQERPAGEQAALDACYAEEQLHSSIAAAKENAFETAKLRHPFLRRFTTAWCWARALHSAVMHAPAIVEGDEAARATKIRQLRLLLDSGLCISQRGRWYSELAKEVGRLEGAVAALRIAAQGIAEGESQPIACRITVDLISDSSSQEEGESSQVFPSLPQDARWDLAKRCRTLSQKAASSKGSVKWTWQRWLRETPAAQEKAAGSDDGGRWLPALVSRLLAEETAAPGAIKSISCTSIGLPSASEQSGRRLYDSYDFKSLTVEELAMQFYFSKEGFDCGVHCEGALLRDLFGILLFSQLFDTSVEGVFMSAYQDAPLDLGTEVFYPSRKAAIEKRLGMLANLSASELAQEVNARFAELHGTKIRGVQWDRYEGPGAALLLQTPLDLSKPEDASRKPPSLNEASRRGLCLRSGDVPAEEHRLGTAAGAVGGRALVAALRLLCMDYNSAGLPDLFVWLMKEGQPPQARFIEVKSERDSLSRRQRLWLATLREAGADAEVCHVRDVPADVHSE